MKLIGNTILITGGSFGRRIKSEEMADAIIRGIENDGYEIGADTTIHMIDMDKKTIEQASII